MTQTTVYTCDICKQSKDRGDLAKIEVKTEGIRIKNCDRYNPPENRHLQGLSEKERISC